MSKKRQSHLAPVAAPEAMKPPAPPQSQNITMQVYGTPSAPPADAAPPPVPTPPPAPVDWGQSQAPVAPAYAPPYAPQAPPAPPVNPAMPLHVAQPAAPVAAPPPVAAPARQNPDGIETCACAWCGRQMVVAYSPSIRRKGWPARHLHFACFDAWGAGGGSLALLDSRARGVNQ
jgi:hypothetical protein